MRILIVKISSLGDIIHAMPAVSGIKEHLPNCHISWLIGQQHSKILEKHPAVDEIILFERERWRGIHAFLRCPEIFRLAKYLHAQHFDVVIDMQGLFRSAFFTWVSRAPIRIGFATAREFSTLFYTHITSIPSSVVHAVDQNAYLVENWLGKIIRRQFHIPIPDHHIESFPTVILVPGSRWQSKCWPTKYFAQLARMILDSHDVEVAIVGSMSDTLLGEQIQTSLLKESRFHNWIGHTSLSELVAIMKNAVVVVSNDSGPMHIASATGTPVVALFGPTESDKTGPYGTQHNILQNKPSCWPCRNKICPKNPMCIAQITPEQVWKSVAEKLELIPKRCTK